MYFPFSGGDYKPQMGLKPLLLKDWIEFDAHQSARRQKKVELFRDHREQVLQVLPGAQEACFELHEVLREHLQSIHPEHAAGLDFRIPASAEKALEQLSLWVQEDWALLGATAPVTLLAGSVCFPSRWDLRSKIGRDSDAIHAPVPQFKETIARPTANFLEKLTVDKPMWRLNWTIHDSDELFCPGPHPGRRDLTEANVIEHSFVRIERQTLRRLPRTGLVVFSIRTYIDPLAGVIVDPERRRLLRETLEGLPEETADYKGMRHLFPLLKKAL